MPKDRSQLSPDELMQIVDQEFPETPPGWDISDYAQVIDVLRKRGLSFRKITAYLAEHGVQTNRTTVYDVWKDYCISLKEQELGEHEPLIDDETGEIVEG